MSEQVVRADIKPKLNAHGVWDNAIFADAASAGYTINGHVAVRGSVHVLGNPSPMPTVEFGGTGDPSEALWTAGGVFLVAVAVNVLAARVKKGSN